MYGGRCYEEIDLPLGGNGTSDGPKQGQMILQQAVTCQLGQVHCSSLLSFNDIN